ncbi:Polyphenol oxidase [Quillaja saponaria]|uniref:Polyphenol oxidase n=1 Tax=Quillaja saponaria TaxID=32244 RepID=A0AAD7M215_QUISA|nr:Polyphenol oxidase [Quillaja saponaria]
MASLSSPLSLITKNPSSSATTTTTSTSSLCSLFRKRSQEASKFGKPNKLYYVRRVSSCKATNGNDPKNRKIDQETNLDKFDRRDILLGLGGAGFYGATGLSNGRLLANAAPISPPDISKCGAADLPEGVAQINCCPPFSSNIIDFKLIPSNAPLRIRPAAHLVDDAYIAKLTKALDLMKALPADDPRSFKQQAAIHCAYCDGAHEQIGFPDLDFQVHDSWLFQPFHRYYLYFFEKILGKLIDDPNFAMPFWNWDSPNGMQIPAIYTNPKSSLHDSLRNANHQPPKLINLDYNGVDETISNDSIVSNNLNLMYRNLVPNARNAKQFLGSPYRAGDEPDPGAGSLENSPHGTVHVWCGDNTQPNHENMGNLYSAGNDPLFYAHHSNVDRLWTVWKTLGGKRKDFTDPDWLNSGFLFYDENANPVRVLVKDCLDSKKLGYVYQDVEIPWLQARPTPRRSKLQRAAQRLGVQKAHAAVTSRTTKFPLVLDSAISSVVKRPKKSRSKKEKEEEEEVLVIEGIEFERDTPVKFDVYVNDEDDLPSGPDKTEFAGSFVNVPHHKHKHNKNSNKHMKNMVTSLGLGLTDLLEDLEVEDDETVVVTLVPRFGKGHVSIKGIKIELED